MESPHVTSSIATWGVILGLCIKAFKSIATVVVTKTHVLSIVASQCSRGVGVGTGIGPSLGLSGEGIVPLEGLSVVPESEFIVADPNFLCIRAVGSVEVWHLFPLDDDTGSEAFLDSYFLRAVLALEVAGGPLVIVGPTFTRGETFASF